MGVSMMRPSNSSLTTDYMRDLEVDIECAERDGLTNYANKCRRELDGLHNAKSIHVDHWGIPTPARTPS